MKKNNLIFAALHGVALLGLIGLSVNFYSSVATEPFKYFLPISYLVLGLILGISFILFNKIVSNNMIKSSLMAIQHLIFLICLVSIHLYLFGKNNYNYLYCASLGLLVSFIVNIVSIQRLQIFYHLILFIITSLVIAISLRLMGITGALLAGLTLVHGAAYLCKHDDEAKFSKLAVIYFSIGFILGRAFLQSYLEASGYAGLGIVITHPYSFVGLLMGMALPFLFQELRENKYLGMVDIYVLIGVLLPIFLYLVFPIRALGSIGMSLLASLFILGILQKIDLTWAFLAPLFLWVVDFIMPYFKDEVQGTRWEKIDEIVTAFVLFAIYLWGRNYIKNKYYKAATA